MIPEGNNQNIQKKEKAHDDAFENNFPQEEEKEQFSNLQIYWRFDEGKGITLNDLSDYEINGLLEWEFEGDHENDEVWNMLDDGDPLELEDKWGKKCPTQYGIDLNLVHIKNVNKPWFEEGELKQFTIEFWLKPRVKQGQIFKISNENFTLILQDCFLKLFVKGKHVVLIEDEVLKDDGNNDDYSQQFRTSTNKNNEENRRVKENFWNHMAVVYDHSQPKTIILYLNCFEIGYSNVVLDGDLFKEKSINIGNGKFNGEITEFRLWKSANSLSEIKDSYRTPLEIVAEKKKKIKMKFKEKDANKNPSEKVDLKKFASFLTMAPPAKGLPKEEEKKIKDTFKKPIEEKEKFQEDDLQVLRFFIIYV